MARQQLIKKRIEELTFKILYHPLTLPRPKEVSLNPQTQDLLQTTHRALNLTNPDLASNCW